MGRQVLPRFAVLLLAAFLWACGPLATPTGQPITAAPVAASPLAGSEWELVSLEGRPLVEGTHISLAFDSEGLSGFAGCNAYGGSPDSGGYTATEDGSLTIQRVAITVMACPEPEGVMEQEQAYVAALTAATAYRLADSSLELQNAAGETTLVFARQEVYEANPDDLHGTSWRIVSLDGQPPIEGSTLTLAFHNGCWASGHAGCRDYVATYQAQGGGLGFGYTAMLGAECGQEALLGQEGNFTTVLGWTAHYRLTGGQLELVTIRGETLTFEPLPPEGQPALEGPTWTLLSFIEPNPPPDTTDVLPMPADVLSDTEITIQLEGGQAGGSAGCNHYGASYTRTGDSLTLAAIAATEMACLGPEGIMEQEQRYLDVLGSVTSAHVYAGRLWLATGDGRALVFVAPE